LSKGRFQPRVAQSLYWFVTLLLGAAYPSHGTSIVILRSPHGARIVVAADSQFSIDADVPVTSCKIIQIEGAYWTAISGLASEPETHFDSYQIALDASSHHKGNLDDIASEVEEKTLALLPLALEKRRKAIGKEAFWREYKAGFDAHEEAFWGVESGTLRLIYIQFVLRRSIFGRLKLSPFIHKCPGDACPDPEAGFAVMLGHHKVIDKFTADHTDWPKGAPLETRAHQFVQMEIASEPDCHCAPPIDVLRVDRFGNTSWVGPRGPGCQAPR
jgi:hypothetical protein